MLCKVSVVIEKDEHGYYAYPPDLEGRQTQGDTVNEVMVKIKEAVELYVKLYKERIAWHLQSAL